jgi:dihydroorotase
VSRCLAQGLTVGRLGGLMSEIVFREVLLASEESGALPLVDVWIDAQGRIAAVDRPGQIPMPAGATVIEGQGRKVLLPACFDAHVHLREPGKVAAETIKSGTEAAINGGITGVVCMPNTTPALDSAAMVQQIQDIARNSGARIPVFISGAITKGRKGQELAELAEMKALGAVMATDDGDPVSNPFVLRRAMEQARTLDLMLASHAEVHELTAGGAMHEGPTSARLGVPGYPSVSEEICIARDCRLAQFTGARLHIQHVSTARGMETISRFRNEGVAVTCEVAPHHLLFIDEDVGDYDTHYKMSPPLRTRADTERLLAGLKEGLFDLIATDHAPHTEAEKKREFVLAPNGITGLETALVSMYDRFIRSGALTWDVLVKRYSAEPRRLCGLPPVPIIVGGAAEVVLFDPEASTTFDRGFMRSLSVNTPYLDKTVHGRVCVVVVGSEILLERA